MCAAAGRIDDERVEIAGPVCLHVGFAQALGALEVAVVGEEGAAAPFAGRKPHVASGHLQETHGRRVRLLTGGSTIADGFADPVDFA